MTDSKLLFFVHGIPFPWHRCACDTFLFSFSPLHDSPYLSTFEENKGSMKQVPYYPKMWIRQTRMKVILPGFRVSNKDNSAECHAPLSCSTKTSSDYGIQSSIHACIRHYHSMIFGSHIWLYILIIQFTYFMLTLSITERLRATILLV